eukprot:gene23605-28591_t
MPRGTSKPTYEDLLTLHSLEVVMPMSSDMAGGETLLLAATGETEADGGDGYSPEEWVLWLASGADEAAYWRTLATYEETYDAVLPDEDAPADLHATDVGIDGSGSDTSEHTLSATHFRPVVPDGSVGGPAVHVLEPAGGFSGSVVVAEPVPVPEDEVPPPWGFDYLRAPSNTPT